MPLAVPTIFHRAPPPPPRASPHLEKTSLALPTSCLPFAVLSRLPYKTQHQTLIAGARGWGLMGDPMRLGFRRKRALGSGDLMTSRLLGWGFQGCGGLGFSRVDICVVMLGVMSALTWVYPPYNLRLLMTYLLHELFQPEPTV